MPERFAHRPWLRLALAPLRWALAGVLLFEEWGWVPLQRALAWVGSWPGFRWLEGRVRALPPYPALALFLLPGVALLPVKLGALWLLGHGQAALGLSLIVATKLLGTAVVARLFTLTQPALMRLAWFSRLHGRWVAWKNELLGWARASALWRGARALKASVRRGLQRFIRR